MFALILLLLTMPPLKEIEKIKSSGKGMAVSKKVNNGKCLLPVVNGTHLNNYLFMFFLAPVFMTVKYLILWV